MKQYELTYNQPQTYLELRKEGLVKKIEAINDTDAIGQARIFGMNQSAELVSLVQVERREVTKFEEDRRTSFEAIADSLFFDKTELREKYEIFRILDDNGNVHRDLEIRIPLKEIPRQKYSFEIKEIKEVPRKPYPGWFSPDF